VSPLDGTKVSEPKMAVGSGAGRAGGVCEKPQIEPKLGAVAAALTDARIGSVPAGLLLPTGFAVYREGKRLSREFVISGWK